MDGYWIGVGFLLVAVVVAVFLIRALSQVSKTVKHLHIMMNNLDREITPLVRNLRDTSENLNHILSQTRDRFNQLEVLFQTVRELTQVFNMVNRILRTGITPTLVNLAGLAVGVKTAGKTLFKGKEKGGK